MVSVANPFAKRREHLRQLENTLRRRRAAKLRTVPENTCVECSSCGKGTTRGELANAMYVCPHCGYHFRINAMYVCPHCGYHFRISAYYRLSIVLDSCSFKELNTSMMGSDPLLFKGYREKLDAQRSQTGLREAVVCATGTIDKHRVAVASMDSSFFMGSMGTAVGEKITRVIEYANRYSLPLIMFCTSGGARMQEGIFSLMQMAKTAAALKKYMSRGGLYISVLTNPTTGGVTASFASLGDITLAEPNALIGFAGPRVIEQTIGEKLPEGFQTSEYLLEHGFIDKIVHRSELRSTLAQLLALHEGSVV